MSSFPNLESVCFSMSGSKCCFLIWHTDFSGGRSGGLAFPSLEEFPTVCCDPHSQRLQHSQSIKQRYMFFWNSIAFSMIQQMLAIWSLVPLPFLKPAWTSGSSQFMPSSLQKKKWTTEDDMVQWHYWLKGHEIEKLLVILEDRGAWGAAVFGVCK